MFEKASTLRERYREQYRQKIRQQMLKEFSKEEQKRRKEERKRFKARIEEAYVRFGMVMNGIEVLPRTREVERFLRSEEEGAAT